MTNRAVSCLLSLFLLSISVGCDLVGSPTPVQHTSVPIQPALTPISTTGPTSTVLSTATADSSPTAVPVAPTATASPTAPAVDEAISVPTPLLAMEKSPQKFGYTETFQVALGDLDSDGDIDAVFANMADNHSAVWLNDGAGQFEVTDQQLTQQGHGLDIGDLDGDGDLDIFITCAHYNGAGKPSVVYLMMAAAHSRGAGKILEMLD